MVEGGKREFCSSETEDEPLGESSGEPLGESSSEILGESSVSRQPTGEC